MLDTWQILARNCAVERLPDGSTVVFETSTKTVHSMNTAAAAAFEACREKRTVPQVAAAMQDILKAPVTEEMALEAIAELNGAGLVACTGSRPPDRRMTSRRSMLKAVGTAAAIAAPLVLSLSSREQRLYAQGAGSGPAPTLNGDDSNTVCSDVAFGQAIHLVGTNTHFNQGTSIVTFTLPWITVTTVTVVDLTHITVVVTSTGPQGGSATGTFNATVVTGAESVTGVGILAFANTCG